MLAVYLGLVCRAGRGLLGASGEKSAAEDGPGCRAGVAHPCPDGHHHGRGYAAGVPAP
jgi:hypothetical protein